MTATPRRRHGVAAASQLAAACTNADISDSGSTPFAAFGAADAATVVRWWCKGGTTVGLLL